MAELYGRIDRFLGNAVVRARDRALARGASPGPCRRWQTLDLSSTSGPVKRMSTHPQPPIADGATMPDDLALRFVTGVRDGVPVLLGLEDRRVLVFERLADAAVGRMAVCRTPCNGEGLVVVLGCIDAAALPAGPPAWPATAQATAPAAVAVQRGGAGAEDAPVVLRSGKSSLTLHPDGRVRLEGADVRVEADGTTALRGAVIKLN